MRITIAAIGRLKDGAERDLYERYASRLDKSGRGVAIGPLTLSQHNESRSGEATQRRDEEAARLVSSSQSASFVFLLDESGRDMGSAEFASKLGTLRDDGVTETAFLIGGPDGHGTVARERANSVLSLGRMTLPHGLARIVLAEQLYRAVTILSGHPYHRE